VRQKLFQDFALELFNDGGCLFVVGAIDVIIIVIGPIKNLVCIVPIYRNDFLDQSILILIYLSK